VVKATFSSVRLVSLSPTTNYHGCELPALVHTIFLLSLVRVNYIAYAFQLNILYLYQAGKKAGGENMDYQPLADEIDSLN
jgi:hypothetical protein